MADGRPVSNSATTDTSSTFIGSKHIENALKLLAPGGRLVAIVGKGMGPEKSRFRDWWKMIGRTYSIRANIGTNGNEYRKYGTTFGNQIVVIDKTGPTQDGSTVVGNVKLIEELPPLLNEVRNGRENIEQPASQSGSIAKIEGNAVAIPNPNGSGVPVPDGSIRDVGPKQPRGTGERNGPPAFPPRAVSDAKPRKASGRDQKS